MIAIDVKNVTKSFREGVTAKRVIALEDLTLQIRKGEVFGFLGPNGAGKSTAIKILLNLIYPDSGSAFILDRSVADIENRKHVGYLPENPYFYDYLSAEEIIWFGGRTSGMNSREIQERSAMLLERVALGHARKRQLKTYSKGMVQRAGLALALIHDPDVVILDEPMSGLDPIGRKMVGDMILEMKSQGKTVFFSSHILTDIERFCDRVGIIINGRLRLVEKLENVVSGKRTLEEVFLDEVQKAGGGVVQ